MIFFWTSKYAFNRLCISMWEIERYDTCSRYFLLEFYLFVFEKKVLLFFLFLKVCGVVCSVTALWLNLVIIWCFEILPMFDVKATILVSGCSLIVDIMLLVQEDKQPFFVLIGGIPKVETLRNVKLCSRMWIFPQSCPRKRRSPIPCLSRKFSRLLGLIRS